MYRVKDPEISIDFYTRLLGMSHIVKLDFPESKFSLHFLGYNVPSSVLAASQEERRAYAFSKPGILELTHNWGTEKDESFSGYHTGNTDPKGYGLYTSHIGIIVDDVAACCSRLEEHGAKFIKKPNEGRMKNIAFVADPDGYWLDNRTLSEQLPPDRSPAALDMARKKAPVKQTGAKQLGILNFVKHDPDPSEDDEEDAQLAEVLAKSQQEWNRKPLHVDNEDEDADLAKALAESERSWKREQTDMYQDISSGNTTPLESEPAALDAANLTGADSGASDTTGDGPSQNCASPTPPVAAPAVEEKCDRASHEPQSPATGNTAQHAGASARLSSGRRVKLVPDVINEEELQRLHHAFVSSLYALYKLDPPPRLTKRKTAMIVSSDDDDISQPPDFLTPAKKSVKRANTATPVQYRLNRSTSSVGSKSPSMLSSSAQKRQYRDVQAEGRGVGEMLETLFDGSEENRSTEDDASPEGGKEAGRDQMPDPAFTTPQRQGRVLPPTFCSGSSEKRKGVGQSIDTPAKRLRTDGVGRGGRRTPSRSASPVSDVFVGETQIREDNLPAYDGMVVCETPMDKRFANLGDEDDGTDGSAGGVPKTPTRVTNRKEDGNSFPNKFTSRLTASRSSSSSPSLGSRSSRGPVSRQDSDTENVADWGKGELPIVIDDEEDGDAVACPVCSRSFPKLEIEVHAADCEGHVEPDRKGKTLDDRQARKNKLEELRQRLVNHKGKKGKGDMEDIIDDFSDNSGSEGTLVKRKGPRVQKRSTSRGPTAKQRKAGDMSDYDGAELMDPILTVNTARVMGQPSVTQASRAVEDIADCQPTGSDHGPEGEIHGNDQHEDTYLDFDAPMDHDYPPSDAEIDDDDQPSLSPIEGFINLNEHADNPQFAMYLKQFDAAQKKGR
ncbi:hypothetical protein HK104_004673, partial [Borealophlyctis nickersoniae]